MNLLARRASAQLLPTTKSLRQSYPLFGFARSLSNLQVQPTLEEDPVDSSSLDWNTLGFDYVPTKSIVLYDTLENGEWSKGRLQGPYVQVHAMSNVFHYGQTLFEGLKAFHQKNGDVVLFNPLENAERLRNGCKRLGMAEVSDDMFLEALSAVVKENLEYVPPYGSGGSLYLRPVLYGHGAKLGLGKAPQFSFAVIASPVGNYYKGGLKAVNALVMDEYDRAAPLGVGSVKCAGNYAADVVPAAEAASQGFPIVLYLDAKERKYVEEFSTSNFIAISNDRQSLITPDSSSILKSITLKMLKQIAADKGMKVEQRPVQYSEVGSFSQVAACGTAVIVTPIKSITRGDDKINFGDDFGDLQSLYQELREIQSGDKPDKYGWCVKVASK